MSLSLITLWIDFVVNISVISSKTFNRTVAENYINKCNEKSFFNYYEKIKYIRAWANGPEKVTFGTHCYHYDDITHLRMLRYINTTYKDLCYNINVAMQPTYIGNCASTWICIRFLRFLILLYIHYETFFFTSVTGIWIWRCKFYVILGFCGVFFQVWFKW